MFKAIFGGMTKFRVISYFILLAALAVLNAAVPPAKQDIVGCFYFFVLFVFSFECCYPVDETKARKKRK